MALWPKGPFHLPPLPGGHLGPGLRYPGLWVHPVTLIFRIDETASYVALAAGTSLSHRPTAPGTRSSSPGYLTPHPLSLFLFVLPCLCSRDVICPKSQVPSFLESCCPLQRSEALVPPKPCKLPTPSRTIATCLSVGKHLPRSSHVNSVGIPLRASPPSVHTSLFPVTLERVLPWPHGGPSKHSSWHPGT